MPPRRFRFARCNGCGHVVQLTAGLELVKQHAQTCPSHAGHECWKIRSSRAARPEIPEPRAPEDGGMDVTKTPLGPQDGVTDHIMDKETSPMGTPHGTRLESQSNNGSMQKDDQGEEGSHEGKTWKYMRPPTPPWMKGPEDDNTKDYPRYSQNNSVLENPDPRGQTSEGDIRRYQRMSPSKDYVLHTEERHSPVDYSGFNYPDLDIFDSSKAMPFMLDSPPSPSLGGSRTRYRNSMYYELMSGFVGTHGGEAHRGQ
ncbi:hypothetical protein Hypma_014593 [Hypsizygus marmoreus]|uniref:Uncharacterized protein n=1 Tax=Hypsizygus marmoreus TaxID=39966 RepID=A0A369J9J5_HYPMA|nr:hypothetical protein Hypma_014593 [Hypsizygus marmoreus]